MPGASDPTRSLSGASAADIQATYAATLVDEWIGLGVRHAVIAPGSRSTPMALAITDRDEISVHVVHDERVAAFIALGLASVGSGGATALLLCTSGTATANFLPAVVEANLSEIPMIVLTADRPPELRGVGAPQTIDQRDLYGRHVRWFHDPGVPTGDARGWRRLAADTFRHAARGPVQVNLAFDEPLLGRAFPLPAGREPDPPHDGEDGVSGMGSIEALDPAPDGIHLQRGVILVGGHHGVEPAALDRLREMTQWPLLADPTSGVRHLAGVVTTADALLRHERFAADHTPEVVIRLGRPPASKVVNQWVSRSKATLVQVGGPGVIDPDHGVVARCTIDVLLAAQPTGATGTTWPTRWTTAERRALAAIDEVLDREDRLTEPGVAREVANWADADTDVVVASSMPVRDLEWFGGPGATAFANRGANGIDGVVSTAVGRSLATRGPAVVVVGDIAFLHDSNALIALRERGVELRVVVVDNDGGGIFSFLPQATALDADRFETLFGTPTGSDIVGLAAAHGLETDDVTTAVALRAALDRDGPRVIRVPSDRGANVDLHDRLNAAVAAAI